MPPETISRMSAVITTIATVVTIVMTVTQYVRAQRLNHSLAAYQHHQKALESLYGASKFGALHVGAVYTLSSLAVDVPTLSDSIAHELAIAALDYSSGVVEPTDTSQASKPLTHEAQAALQVIGNLQIMQAGLPLNLAGGYFFGASVPFAQFNGVHFWGANLSGSDLYQAQLYGADFRFAILNGASFAAARLTNAGFYGALLCPGINTVVAAQNTGTAVPVSFSGAKLDHANFDQAWLVKVRFDSGPKEPDDTRTYLFGASFKGAELQGAHFENTILDYADFSGADLTDASFINASGVEHVRIDSYTRLCRTQGLKMPNLKDSCAQSKTPAPVYQCTRYKAWRSLE
jgi:uncharacterized protein YjbI with pentapeptide repeats